jgi:hypothetical protein
MTLAGHGLDHLPDDILNTGPPTALWEFVTERSMGEVARSVTSRMYPFAQLANTLLQREQLKVMRMRYPDLSRVVDYSAGRRRDWNDVSAAEKYFPEISEPRSNPILTYTDYGTLNTPIDEKIILRTPHSWYKLTLSERTAIGVYFKNLLEITASPKLIAKYLPNQVERWGKIRFKGDAECVRSRWAHESVRETYRDASFARVSP